MCHSFISGIFRVIHAAQASQINTKSALTRQCNFLLISRRLNLRTKATPGCPNHSHNHNHINIATSSPAPLHIQLLRISTLHQSWLLPRCSSALPPPSSPPLPPSSRRPWPCDPRRPHPRRASLCRAMGPCTLPRFPGLLSPMAR